MCWEIPKVSKSEKASAAETAYSVLPTAAFLLTAFLQLKDKSRVGGRNCGWAEFASEISQLPKNTDNRNKDKSRGISGPLKARSKHRLYLQKQMIKTLQILFSVKVNYN